MPPPRDDIARLVDGFARNITALRSPDVNEARIRLEYINPLWQALGWDVDNRAQRTSAEKDVVVEASVGTIEGQRLRSRRPDYLFRIGGFPRFVVEAKQPAVDLATDKDSIFQAKTYAWSAQIPFAVLTDFEEFRLFDCTLKPTYNEPNRGVVRDFDLRFADYLTQWDVLLSTFGREAVANGSLESLLARIKNLRAGRRLRTVDRMLVDLRGSEPVDQAFLAFLEDYRKRFAREIYRANRTVFPEANTRHGAAKLTEAVQRLIDRLVFMRVCEDRDIAEWGGLRQTLDRIADERGDLYQALVGEFRDLDRSYNGYLFKPHFSEGLSVSGELLAEFIRNLYLPDGPYRFDAIGDDILGIIYERFLGNVVTVKRGQAEVEAKPEVRHAGGVYYTPRFVVDTIIRRAIGPKLVGKTPLEVLGVKVLDPACGSGSFLVAAFQYLIDHCERYVTAHPDAAQVPATPRARTRRRPIAFRDREGAWLLAPDFKAALLTSCLHGVDIDQQAVEVTIMSLYLKMLEGELPPHWQQDWLENQLLPPLDNNIRCGNSLIQSADFDNWWDETRGTLFAGDEDTRFRINRFDWASDTRGFGRVLNEHGGFDCIIGNPPYIRVQELNEWAPEECEFYKWKYRSARQGNYDIYVVFTERGLQLLAPDGLLGFIMPHKFWTARYGAEIRRLIAEGRNIRSLIDFTHEQVFREVTTYTAIHVLGKTPNPGPIDYARVTALVDGRSLCVALDTHGAAIPEGTERWQAPHPSPTDPMFRFVPQTFTAGTGGEFAPLSTVAELSQGFKTGADPVFVVTLTRLRGDLATITSEATGTTHEVEAAALRPLVKSEHMRRFALSPTTLRLVFPYEVNGTEWHLFDPETMEQRFPRLFRDYLRPLRTRLAGREHGRWDGDQFYQFSRQQNFVALSKPKIISPDIAERPRMAWDARGEFVFSGGGAGGVGIIPSADYSPLFMVGLLNSKFMEDQIRYGGTPYRGGYLNCEIRFLRNLPIPTLHSGAQRRVAARIEEIAGRVGTLRVQLQSDRLGDRERDRLGRDADAQEARIDELVARLYGVAIVP